MSDHIQYRDEILHGRFFSPELMVTSDIESEEIYNVAEKFWRCHQKSCYKAIYNDKNMIDGLRPSKRTIFPTSTTRKNIKSEL